MIWLPLILLFSELFIRNRNYLYAFLGGVAFNILAGHPQYFFYTAVAVVAYFIIRITQEFSGHRNWKYVGYHASGVFIIYIYTIGVLLAAIQLLPAFEMIKHSAFYNRNKFTKAFLIMALITTILALGKVTTLFKILYTIVPGFNMFRGNCKFIFIVAFSLSVLSGIGAGYGTWHGIINKIYLEEATNIIDHNYRLNKI
jgi:hypothetical protein